jgi:hypothetical protein
MDPDFTGKLSTEEHMRNLRGGQYDAPKTPGIMTGDPLSPPVNPCPNHPDREQRIGKHGKSLGVCNECLATRPSMQNLNLIRGGRERFVQLYFREKHLDLKVWLEREAEENERTIQEQVLYTLKKGREAICPK